MFLLFWFMNTSLINSLGGNSSKICRWVGRTSLSPETTRSSSALEFLHWSILLWNNPLSPNVLLKILYSTASLSATNLLSVMGKLLSLTEISCSAWTLIGSVPHGTPLLSMLSNISCNFFRSTCYIPPSYYYNPNSWSLWNYCVTLQSLWTAWNSTLGNVGDKNQRTLEIIDSLPSSPTSRYSS